MRTLLTLLVAAVLAVGCVSVKHAHNLVPPSGLASDLRAPLVLPKEPVPCTNLKVGKGSRSVYVKEWVYSGVSADVTDMALTDAVKSAGIKRLLYADYEQCSFLGFVTVFTVTAYGE